MSAYACPGCGEDAPLSQECPRCEEVEVNGLRARLRATRAQLLQEMWDHNKSLGMLGAEAQRERSMGEKLRQDIGNLHIRLAAALSDADECRHLRDLALKSLELRTKELLDLQADDRLLKVAAIFNAWANGDEPEGQASSRRCMLAIGEILGDPLAPAKAAP